MTETSVISIEDLPPLIGAEARLLGLDVGSKTIGMALSDVTRSIATPFDTIRRTKFTAMPRRFATSLNRIRSAPW